MKHSPEQPRLPGRDLQRQAKATALSASTIATVSTILSALPQPPTLRGQQKRRNPLVLLQTALCQLGILDEPVLLQAKTPTNYAAMWADDKSIDPLWGAWIRAYYEQTAHLNEGTIRHHCYHLLTAGRWLKQQHPEVAEPGQWTEALASESHGIRNEFSPGEFLQNEECESIQALQQWSELWDHITKRCRADCSKLAVRIAQTSRAAL